MHPDLFDYDHAWILEGTLHTQHAEAIQAAIHRLFSLPTDPQADRYALYDRSTPNTLTLTLRHDDYDVDSRLIIRAILDADAEAVGRLTLQWPYTVLQEEDFPVDLVFEGQRQARLLPYTLRPAYSPSWIWHSDGSESAPKSTPAISLILRESIESRIRQAYAQRLGYAPASLVNHDFLQACIDAVQETLASHASDSTDSTHWAASAIDALTGLVNDLQTIIAAPGSPPIPREGIDTAPV